LNTQRIVERMDELGIKQSQLAKKSGLSTGYINGLVHGTRGKRIGAETAQKLAKGLKVSVSFFLQS
jgi:transcriptional regulator with XRE-family HTH domain